MNSGRGPILQLTIGNNSMLPKTHHTHLMNFCNCEVGSGTNVLISIVCLKEEREGVGVRGEGSGGVVGVRGEGWG